jgi:PAS domain S-box-containing protein
MRDEAKTKRQLIQENEELRNQIESLKGYEEQINQKRESYDKFAKAFLKNSIPVVLTTLDEGRFVEISEAFLRLMGHRRDEVIGHSSTELGFITEEQRSSFISELNRKGCVENFEMQVRVKGGEIRHGLFNAVMIILDNRNLLHTVMIDITKRKRAEEGLAKSEEKYHMLLEYAGDAIILADPQGRFLDANRQVEKLLGYERDEILKLTVTMIHPENEINRVMKAFEDMKEKTFTLLDTKVLRKDGKAVAVDITGNRIEISGENVLQGIFRDITERKMLEEELNRYRENLERMVSERTEDLEVKTKNLEELNTALNVLLRKREEDKRDLEERFVANIGNLIQPYVNKLRNGNLDKQKQLCLDIIENHLREIVTPLLKNLGQFGLTTREVHVATMIRGGKTTKEISEILGVGISGIDFHRKNIRKKLGLGKRSNLHVRLQSI